MMKQSQLNPKCEGSVIGHWVKVVQPIQLLQGYNDLVLLSQTVGLQTGVGGILKDHCGTLARSFPILASSWFAMKLEMPTLIEEIFEFGQ
ncbi:hypothetical protein AAG906_016626 [Vitis piasezkii]|uniref:Beta-galactosidase 9 n=1 Tax=Vitis vinifera TaxID=29760 RepID=A0A438BWI7_VITVI|nr:Beta-galactosidase 9 [Vitis vinifera]RVW99760.1 Beta-galactosidase 9 [Vitis vinifera]